LTSERSGNAPSFRNAARSSGGVKQQRESDRREVNLFIENEMLKFERRLPSGKEENEK